MPERKRSGRIAAFTIGGAASAFGITQVRASASAANDSDPTRNVTVNSRSGPPVGIGESYTNRPNTSVIATRIAPTTIAWRTLAAMYAPAGSGVPRSRFRIPLSRLNVVWIAMFVKHADTTPNAAIAPT